MTVKKQNGGSCDTGVCGLQLGGSKTKHSRQTKQTKKSKKQSGRGCGCGVGGSKRKNKK